LEPLERATYEPATAAGAIVPVPVEAHAPAARRATTTVGPASDPGRSGAGAAPARPAETSAPAEAADRKAGDRDREVEALWAAFRDCPGDETRNALFDAYVGFANEITRRFAARLPRSVDRGDLQTAGNVGLMNAIGGYDPERGVRFESYCELRVKGALLDELRTQDWLPRPWRQRIEQQKRAVEALRAREVREPSDEEIAAEMGLCVDLYQQIFGVGLPGVPSGTMATDGSDEEHSGPLDVVPDPASDDLDAGLTREELLTLVRQRLTEQEYRILFLRYWEGMAMREIGEVTGLSESRVCKIHARLLERLHERLRVGDDDA
jgi:RNA polymerase sigma factor for flagellar operon FliA